MQQDKLIIVNLMANDFFHYYDIHREDFPKNMYGYSLYLYLAKKLNIPDDIINYNEINNQIFLEKIKDIDESKMSSILKERINDLEYIMQDGLKDIISKPRVLEKK